MQVGRDETVVWPLHRPQEKGALLVSRLGKPVVWPYLAIQRGASVVAIARLMVDEETFWRELASALEMNFTLPDGTRYAPNKGDTFPAASSSERGV
jgi:hypothetical protein